MAKHKKNRNQERSVTLSANEYYALGIAYSQLKSVVAEINALEMAKAAQGEDNDTTNMSDTLIFGIAFGIQALELPLKETRRIYANTNGILGDPMILKDAIEDTDFFLQNVEQENDEFSINMPATLKSRYVAAADILAPVVNSVQNARLMLQ